MVVLVARAVTRVHDTGSVIIVVMIVSRCLGLIPGYVQFAGGGFLAASDRDTDNFLGLPLAVMPECKTRDRPQSRFHQL
jgi:hypothetical protein